MVKHVVIADELWPKVVSEFKAKGYLNCPKDFSDLSLEDVLVKVLRLKGSGLPTIFLRKKDGKPTHSLMIHPETPRESLMPYLKINKLTRKDPYLFMNADVSPFPPLIENHPSRCYLLAQFVSLEELGKILEILIEIERKYLNLRKTTRSQSRPEVNEIEHKIEPDKIDPLGDIYTQVALEGKKKLAFTHYYERDKKLRQAAINEFGYSCRVCGLNFESRYGELGKNFIEVHHKEPVSEGEKEVDYRQLIPLCPNCHRMIHRLYKKLRPEEYESAIDILRNTIAE